MDAALRRLIEALHAAPPRLVICVTGGGATAIAQLLAVPGASRTVLEAVVPYSPTALTAWLGESPAQFVSVDTARKLADRAFDRASLLDPAGPIVGVGCTATLATDRPKRGDHRFHVAVRTATETIGCALTLAKGHRDRAGEEAVLTAVLLNAIAEAFGIADRLRVELAPGEVIETERSRGGTLLEAFLRHEVPTVCREPDGRFAVTVPRPHAVLPGSFNPLHGGHARLARVAAELTGLPTAFELAVVNVDKPMLSAEEVRRRGEQFGWYAPLWLTRAATFSEKAAIFPGSTFVVGHDTAVRIVAARYYGDDSTRMRAALTAIRDAGCRFLVAGRCDAAGTFLGWETVAVPAEFREMFTGIPESLFREDVSSTQLRASKPAG